MNTKQIIGLVGSLVALFGCFFAVLHIEGLGNLTIILKDGEVLDGVLVVALCLIGVVAAISQLQGLLSAIAIMNSAILLNVWRAASEAATERGLDIESRLGTPLIVIGLVLMFVSAFLAKPSVDQVSRGTDTFLGKYQDSINTSIWIVFAVCVAWIILETGGILTVW